MDFVHRVRYWVGLSRVSLYCERLDHAGEMTSGLKRQRSIEDLTKKRS